MGQWSKYWPEIDPFVCANGNLRLGDSALSPPENPPAFFHYVFVSQCGLLYCFSRCQACPDEHGIEDRALSTAIWPDEYRQWGEIFELPSRIPRKLFISIELIKVQLLLTQ